jgi:ankyrin repeat protein
MAARMGRVSVLRVMLASKHVDPNVKERWIDRSPLTAAVMARQREAVEVLLDHPDIRPNDRNEDGKSPLAIAVELGEEEIVRLLLQHPAIKINSADHAGQTPLSRAKALGRDDLVQLLKNRMVVDDSGRRYFPSSKK